MARGRGSSRSRRVTTYRLRPREAGPSANRSQLVLAIGAIVVLGALGVLLVTSGALARFIGPGSTPGPSLPAALPAGTYQSRSFQPPLTFTIPDGWYLAEDSPDFLQLQPVESRDVGIYLFRDPSAASQDASCPLVPEPGVGGLSTDLSTWIRGRPGLVTSNPRLAEVGGLRGIELDAGIVDTWTASCSFANGAPTVPLFVKEASKLRWVVAGSERLRLSLLDVPGGGTVVVDIDAFDGTLMPAFLARATPIVQGFQFASSNASPIAGPSASSPAGPNPSPSGG